MNFVNSKVLMGVTSIGGLVGIAVSACFALGPIVQLGLIKIHSFDIVRTSPATTSIATDLVAKAEMLAVQKAVLDYGYQTMLAGAFISASTYLSACILNRYLIHGNTEGS